MTLTPLLRVKDRILGPRGPWDCQNEWYGYVDEFKFTIGLAGLMGFGVGCCRPELLPDDMAPMTGCYDPRSPNYGNYIHIPSASIMCFLPAHYIDIQAPGNTNAPYYGTRVIISDSQTGDSVLARPFRDGGQNLAGVFVDKYHCCNVRPDGSGTPNSTSGNPGDPMLTDGIAASRPLQWPMTQNTTSTQYSGFSSLTSKALNSNATTPVDTFGGTFAAARTRGIVFNVSPIWTHAQLAFLSLAHAQALLDSSGNPIANSTNNAAWMDVAPYAPKGNCNSGTDSNKTSLSFGRTDLAGSCVTALGFAGRDPIAFTGSARISGTPAVEHTTHNGQLSGIVDLNGNIYEIVPGYTCDGSQGGFRMYSENVSWNLATSNDDVYRYGITWKFNSNDDGVYWPSSAGGSLIAHSGGTFHPNNTWNGQPTRKMMTQCMIPRQAALGGMVSTNIYGGDAVSLDVNIGVIPTAGGSWVAGAGSGVFWQSIGAFPNNVPNWAGFRCQRLLAA